MTKAILPTNNTDWGFWSTIRHQADPAEAWPITMQAVAAATGCTDIAVRDFLDSCSAAISQTTWRTAC